MTVVAVVASGADWDARVIAEIDRDRDLVLLRRCVDVDDLIAAVSTGQADCALVGVEAPGLDQVAVAALRHHGVEPVVVVPAGPGAEAAAERVRRIGATRTVSQQELASIGQALRASIGSADPTPSDTAAADSGPTITVWGPTGAPGRTTVATALAAESAARGLPTLIVDADPYGGTVGQHLGVIDEVCGILAANRSVPGAVRQVWTDLHAVTGLPRADRWTEIRSGLVGEIVDFWSGVTVIDAGFCTEQSDADFGRPGRNQLTIEALEAADVVVAVGRADPVGLARLARGLVELAETGLTPTVVINQVRPGIGWSTTQIAGTIHDLVPDLEIHFLPHDLTAIDKAMVSGSSLIQAAGSSALVKAVRRLADAVLPVTDRPVTRRRAGRSRSR